MCQLSLINYFIFTTVYHIATLSNYFIRLMISPPPIGVVSSFCEMLYSSTYLRSRTWILSIYFLVIIYNLMVYMRENLLKFNLLKYILMYKSILKIIPKINIDLKKKLSPSLQNSEKVLYIREQCVLIVQYSTYAFVPI